MVIGFYPNATVLRRHICVSYDLYVFPYGYIVTEGLMSRGKYCKLSVRLGCATAFPLGSLPQSSGRVKHTSGTIKTQLEKHLKAFHLPWPKALPIVLLNLKSTPFGKHGLSPYFILIGHPMHLDKGPCEPTLLNGDFLNYYQGLTNQLKEIDK